MDIRVCEKYGIKYRLYVYALLQKKNINKNYSTEIVISSIFDKCGDARMPDQSPDTHSLRISS